jgi:hypothetical protein
MPTQYSSQELLELSIEWATLKNPDTFLVHNLSISSLEDMSMFNADDLDMSSFNATISPHLNLNHFVDRADEEEQGSEFIQSTLLEAFKSLAVKKEVMQLMDEELKTLGLTDKTDPSVDFSKKVSHISECFGKILTKSQALAIAQARMISKHSGLDIDDLFGGSKYDFEVQLNTLRGGYANCRERVTIYFDFKVQFWSFLEALQEATALCVIPPPDLRKQYGVGAEDAYSHSAPSKNGKSRIIPHFSGGGMAVKAALKDKEVARGSSPTCSRTHRYQKPEARKPRGYTLEHGPWLWYKMSKQQKGWEKITDYQSFTRMIYHMEHNPTTLDDGPRSLVMAHVSLPFSIRALQLVLT